MADNPTDLQGIRRELAAVLENQRRDRELITRLALHVDQGFADLRRDIAEVKADVVMLENANPSRHGEILSLMRRLDTNGLPLDDETTPRPRPTQG